MVFGIIGSTIINNDTVNSDDYTVKFTGSNGVLELGNNSVMSGIISGGNEENIIISKGNINVGQKGTENF